MKYGFPRYTATLSTSEAVSIRVLKKNWGIYSTPPEELLTVLGEFVGMVGG